MIIKANLWKKLLKSAYDSTGLHLAMISQEPAEEVLLMRKDDDWIINVAMSEMPKEYKAELIRLVGDLPQVGEAILYHRGEKPQFEMEEASIGVMNLWGMLSGFRFAYEQTQFLYGDRVHYRLLRCFESGTKHMVAVSEEILRGIQPFTLTDEPTDEKTCMGPHGNADYGCPRLVWYNNVMLFVTNAYSPKPETYEGLVFAELEKPHLVMTEVEKREDKRRQEQRREAELADEDEEE